MALSNIEIIRFRTGDRVEPYFVSDNEINSYLELNSNNLAKTTMDVAQAILFQLAANPSAYRERTGEEEVYTSDAYKSYRDSLLLLIRYPHRFMGSLMPYCAGLTHSDKRIYSGNFDNILPGENLPGNSNTEKFFNNNVLPNEIAPVIVIVE